MTVVRRTRGAILASRQWIRWVCPPAWLSPPAGRWASPAVATAPTNVAIASLQTTDFPPRIDRVTSDRAGVLSVTTRAARRTAPIKRFSPHAFARTLTIVHTMDELEVECENCGTIQGVSAEDAPVCENCGSANLTQVQAV